MSRWTFAVTPRAEFHELYLDAWRLERDYFYDRRCMGWTGKRIRDRYLPLVDRVADRDELNDVIAQMVSELSALHIFVHGGDSRESRRMTWRLRPWARCLRRDEKAGGFVVQHIYLHDPDLPNEAPPLARPDSMVREGEVILSIDGEDSLSVPDERALLRGKAGRKVLLRVKSAAGQTRDVMVTPISEKDERNLRYTEWEYSRRQKVETDSQSQIGYVHLRTMGVGRHRTVGARVLSGVRPPGTDHRCAAQRRRQHRFLGAGEAAAQGLVLSGSRAWGIRVPICNMRFADILSCSATG